MFEYAAEPIRNPQIVPAMGVRYCCIYAADTAVYNILLILLYIYCYAVFCTAVVLCVFRYPACCTGTAAVPPGTTVDAAVPSVTHPSFLPLFVHLSYSSKLYCCTFYFFTAAVLLL